MLLQRCKQAFKFLIKPFIRTDINALTLELSKSWLNNELYKSKKPLVPLDIDLIILSYNSSKWIRDFLKSVYDQNYPTSKINVYVVDNSSTDDTVEIFQECFKKYSSSFNSMQITIQPSLGFGSGHDYAIRQGKSKYIFISNIDGNLEKDALQKVVHAAENDELCVASWELRQKPYEYHKYYDPVSLETPWSAYAAVLIRRDAYEKVGGFEKKIFMYSEDVELSYRFRSYGYKIKYCPSAVIMHYTYEDGTIKPLQYIKSILTNSYIRLRYGSLLNIIAIIFTYLSLFVRRTKFPGAKKLLLKNCFDIAKNAKYFLTSRKRISKVIFPFRWIDYTIARYGKFVKTEEIIIDKPLVSVIMRTTKMRQFDQLRCSIKTVSNQTYDNIELIIVEDGGRVHQKNCEQLCNDLELNYKYYSLQKIGRSSAGNYGLKQASGEYLMFLDDDDYLFADHVETIISYIAQDQNYVAGYSLAWEAMIDKKSKTLDCKNLEVPASLLQDYDFKILQKRNFIPIQSIIFKKQLFLERGGFDESLDYLEDWNLWYRYGYKNRFKFIPKVTSIYTITHKLREFVARNKKMKDSYLNAKSKAHHRILELQNSEEIKYKL